MDHEITLNYAPFCGVLGYAEEEEPLLQRSQRKRNQ